MNEKRLIDMRNMLVEVQAGTWRPDASRVADVGIRPHHVGRFGIASWFRRDFGGCGYTACAIGHAALDSRFPYIALWWTEVMQGVCSSVMEMSKEFGITEADFHFLFMPGQYAIPEFVEARDVALRIDFMLNGGSWRTCEDAYLSESFRGLSGACYHP